MLDRKLKLHCLALPNDDPGAIFSVKIDNDKKVCDLKNVIKRTMKPEVKVMASNLALWSCSIPVSSDLGGTLTSLRFDGTDSRLNRLQALDKLSEHFKDELPERSIHILVGLRDPATSRKRPLDIVESWRSKQVKRELPSLEELREILEEPLGPDEKVPLTKAMYNSLISMSTEDACLDHDLDNLFRIGEPDGGTIHIFVAARHPPPSCGTKASFHWFWDTNIRIILETLIPTAKIIRHSNQHTETRKLRPDFGLLLKNMCPFRGEETGRDNSEDPKAELANNLNWVYDPAPYVLGYYCRGSELTLVAITAPTGSLGSKPEVHDLVSVDLKWRKDRIANIRHLINLASIITQLPRVVQFPVNDFAVFEGTNSTVQITNTRVVKTYIYPDAKARVEHLQRVYAVITARSIPNTDRLVFTKGNVVHLSPRGIALEPIVEEELRECLICVLESLIAAHRVPIFHRDIRWDNIIRRIDDQSKWLLIDWEDAAAPPTKAQPSFTRSTHSPTIFEDDHGAEVDIWGVGYLIKTCKAESVSSELRALGKRIFEEFRSLSAEDILKLIKAFS